VLAKRLENGGGGGLWLSFVRTGLKLSRSACVIVEAPTVPWRGRCRKVERSPKRMVEIESPSPQGARFGDPRFAPRSGRLRPFTVRAH